MSLNTSVRFRLLLLYMYESTALRKVPMTNLLQGKGQPPRNMYRFAILFLTFFALVSLLHAQTGKGRQRHSTLSSRTFHGQALSAENWTRVSNSRLFINDYEPSVLVRLENSLAELSTNSGETFDAIVSPVEDTAGLRFYFEANESGHLYAQSASGLIFFSGTQGESWSPVPLPQGFEPGKPAPFAVLNDGQTRLLLGGPAGLFTAELTSDDDGEPAFGPWERLSDLGPLTTIAVAFNQDAVAPGTGSGVVHITEDTTAFDPSLWISSPLRSGSVSVLEFSPSDSQRVLAGFAGPGSQDNEAPLYYTENGGRFWHSGAGTGDEALPNEPILSLSYSEQDADAFLVYAVTPSGVYVTSDFLTWALEAGLPEGEPVVELRAVKGRSILAQTSTATLAAAPPAATVRCSYEVTPLSVKIDAKGGNVEISVNANSSTCARTVSKPSSTSPLKIVSGASGYGDGKVVLSVAPNITTKSRTMTITIAGKRVTITQAAGTAAPCSVQLQQGSGSFGSLDNEIGIFSIIRGTRQADGKRALETQPELCNIFD